VAQVKADYARAELTPLDRALCDYAMKMTRTPGAMAQADVDQLRSFGLSDRAITDAVQVISFFNYINRVADALGVDLEPGMPPKGAAPN
jgi:uncharacterized peroxidase-related enzyme